MSNNKRGLRKISKVADKILKNEEKYSNYSQEQIIELVASWRGQNLEDIREDVFILCREITGRVLGKLQYKVQLIGGLVLAQGRIAEMRTGEGKTLTELCPAFLKALSGKGVHILTVNDYLCERDYEEMRHVYEYAGLTVGMVINDSSFTQRKDAYAKDITYTTNTEVGFDYLRDNTAKTFEGQVLRGLNYVIIDELDSVLIDDARTPLILAREVAVDNNLYEFVTKALECITDEDLDYDIKDNYVIPNEKGIAKIEKALGLKNFSWKENSIKRHIIYQCLKARYLFKVDRDYIIVDGEVVLIDISTGRIADGRKLSDGLHQAIEAKEKLQITGDTLTTASITYQNFFKLYKTVSGMSGTIATDSAEMEEFYDLDVVVIPTNKPVIRIDEEDEICLNRVDKYNKIVADIKKSVERGIPVLVGTSNIKESELLSIKLRESNIEHNVLNAKTKKDEADIISRAGEKGRVTIATNIAGRGTDIKISDEVNELGGLRVIATERNISKRIDNQLIGRSGRQGNNGTSKFYLSESDELYSEYADEIFINKGKKIKKKGIKLDRFFNHVKKTVYKTQKVVELQGYEGRKEVLKRDSVIDIHRNIIYKQRQEIIEKNYDMNIALANLILEEVSITTKAFDNIDKIVHELSKKFNIHLVSKDFEEENDAINSYTEQIIKWYNSIACTTDFVIADALVEVLVYFMDKRWVTHVEKMEALKRSANYQSYMQIDPFTFYKKEAGTLYVEMINGIREDFLQEVFHNLLSQVKEAEETKAEEVI